MNYTAFTRVAPNGAAPEIRTSKDDMSYLSTADMVISTTRLSISHLGTYQDVAPTGLTQEERSATS